MVNNQYKPISAKQLQSIMETISSILDSIEIKNRDDDICVRAGWTIEIVFHDGDNLQVRERAWKVTDFFIETVGAQNLVYWQGGYPKSFLSKGAQEEISDQKKNTMNNPGGYAMIFNLASGKPKPPDPWVDNAQDFRFKCWLRETDSMYAANRWTPGVGPNMSYIRMHLHVPWINAQPPERSAIWFTSRVVELIQPFWCCAGWGLMTTVEERSFSNRYNIPQMIFPYLKLFPGLNAIDELCLGDTIFNNSMPSVNWLNYVSDPLLDQIGGREAVRQQIRASKDLRDRDVGNCLCIIAGSIPALGDTEGKVILPGYGQAARLLKPIRVKSYNNRFVGPPPSGSAGSAWKLACDEYLSRFDLF